MELRLTSQIEIMILEYVDVETTISIIENDRSISFEDFERLNQRLNYLRNRICDYVVHQIEGQIKRGA